MKVAEAIIQLYKKIPFITNLFTEGFTIVNITFVGTIATVTTDKFHGLDIDDTCTITDLYYPIDITSINRTLDKLSVVTAANHDFSEGFQKTVEISGAIESEFNGTFEILQVPNQTNLILKTIDSGPIASTGTPFLKQLTGSGFNEIIGYKQVLSVPSGNSFTFALTTPLNAVISAQGGVAVGFRITGAINFENAFRMYTETKKEGEYWAFVVSGPNVASRDRKNNSDALYVNNRNTAYRQELNQTFAVYVFVTVGENDDAYVIKDTMQEVAVALISSLCGYQFENGFSASNYYANVFDTHNTHFYDKSVYAHVFSFQTTAQVTDSDIFTPSDDVAITQIDFEMDSVLESFEIKPNTESLDGQVKL